MRPVLDHSRAPSHGSQGRGLEPATLFGEDRKPGSLRFALIMICPGPVLLAHVGHAAGRWS